MATGGIPIIRSRSLLLGICVLVLAGCGRFASSDEAARAAAADEQAAALAEAEGGADEGPEEGTDAGEDPAAGPPSSVADPTIGATAPAPGTGAPTQPAASPPGPRNAAAATNDGFEVRVVAEDGPEYSSKPRFRIQVTLTNRSDRTRYHYLGQEDFAALVDAAGTPVWTSTACNPTLGAYEISGGAAPIEPGQEVSVVVDYPMAGESGECHLADGEYTLYGLFPVCSDDEVRETSNPGTYACPEESVVLHRSAGLRITFG